MHLTEDRRDGVCEKVEDLSTKVALLKDHLAKQTFNVRLEHHWELENIRNCFAEFKWRIHRLDTDEDSQVARHRQALDAAWAELVHAIDVLLAALPEKGATKNGLQAIRVQDYPGPHQTGRVQRESQFWLN